MSDIQETGTYSSDELEAEILKYLPFMTVPDTIKRNEAERKIFDMSKNPNFFYSLTNLYTQNPSQNMMIGILLRNALSAKDITVKKQVEDKYYNSNHKDEIKRKLLQMRDPISIDCIARIGTLEIIKSQWTEYFLECQDKSLILTCKYLQDYDYDFSEVLNIIINRLRNNYDSLLEIIEIFHNNLSNDLLQTLLKYCISNNNIEGLLKIFDHFFYSIENKEHICDFITKQGSFDTKSEQNDNIDEDVLIQLYTILDKYNYLYNPVCLFIYLNSDDPRILSNIENILCDLLPKIFTAPDQSHLKNITESAIVAFLKKNVNNLSFDKMIGCCPQMNDVQYYSRFVHNESFWTLSRISKYNLRQFAVFLPDIIKCTLLSIEKRIDEDACSLLQTLATQMDPDSYENELSFCFIDILNTLVLTSEKISYTEYTKRSAIFSALIELIKTCSKQLNYSLERLLFYLINKVKESLKIINKLNENEFLILEDILTWYITLIEEILKKHSESNYFESVYDIYYDILNIKKISSLVGDVYISLSTLISQSSFFLGKIEEIVEFIVRDIKYRPGQDFYTFKAAHLLIGDISEILSKGILKYSFLAEMVITNLGSDSVQRSIKPILLSILSDLIFSMGTSFNYKDLTCGMLKEIIHLDRSMDILFIDELRRCALILLDTLILVFERDIPFYIINLYMGTILKEDERFHCTSQLVDLAIDYIAIFDTAQYRDILLSVLSVGQCANKGKVDTLQSMLEQ